MSAHDLITALGGALVHFLWQGALVAALAALALRVLRRATPQARYLVLACAMALCALLPVATFGALAWHADAGIAEVGRPASTATATPSRAATESVAIAAPTPLVRAVPARLQPHLPALVACWAFGAALFALRLAFGLGWVSRMTRGRTDPAWQQRLDALARTLGIARGVALRVVDGLDTPVAARVLRPVVLLPASLVARMPVELLEALLAHELAHVRRHDYLVNLLQTALEALLFYHPAVWWLSHQLRVERELVADDLAARALDDPRRLARALDRLARLRVDDAAASVPSAGVPAHPTLALAADGGSLVNRIQRLVRPGHAASGRGLAIVVFGLSAACLAALAQADGAATASASEAASEEQARALAAADSASAAAAQARTAAGAAGAAKAEVGAEARAAAEARVAARADAADVRGRIHLSEDGDGTRYAFVQGGDAGIHYSGDTDGLRDVQTLRRRIDGDFIWTERDGRDWVIRDAATLARVRDAWAPTRPVSDQMDALSARMDAENDKMEAISERMEAASDQGEAQSAEMERLGEQMEMLGEQMEPIADALAEADGDAERARLEAKMADLQGRMEALSRRMEAESAELERRHAPLEALGREMEAASRPLEALGRQMEGLGRQMERLSAVAKRETRAAIDEAVAAGRAEPADALRR